MPSYDLERIFIDTRGDFQRLQIQNEFHLDLLTTRLIVERVGESDNMGWWESRVLSNTGRVRLDEVTPKTRTMSRIKLAQKVVRKVELDQVPDDSLTLFSFGPRIETRLSATVDDIEADESIKFDALENLSISSIESGWTTPLIENIENGSTENNDLPPVPDPDSSGNILLSEDGYTQEALDREKETLLINFLRGYGTASDELFVPYYPLESEIKKRNR